MNAAGVLICFCLSFGGGSPPADRWVGEDKWKHFFASFVITSMAASGSRAAGADVEPSMWIGAGTGTAFGVWKELRDIGRDGETASVKDLVWDLAGVGAASAVMRQVR